MTERAQQMRSFAAELHKLAKAASLGQPWSCQQGLRATQLVNLIRGASFELRTPHIEPGHDPIAHAHAAFDAIERDVSG